MFFSEFINQSKKHCFKCGIGYVSILLVFNNKKQKIIL